MGTANKIDEHVPEEAVRITKTRVAYRVVSAMTMLFVIVAALLAISHLVGMRYYVVMSGSMTPTMPTGSLCVVSEPYPYDKVGVGDVIAFRTESGDITTHRVSAIASRGLVTKGDANEDVDAAPVTRVGYMGRVLWHAAGLGLVVELVLSPAGIAVIVVGVLALLVAELALKRAADVEDAVDAGSAAGGATTGSLDALVARAAESAVRSALADYFGPLETLGDDAAAPVGAVGQSTSSNGSSAHDGPRGGEADHE